MEERCASVTLIATESTGIAEIHQGSETAKLVSVIQAETASEKRRSMNASLKRRGSEAVNERYEENVTGKGKTWKNAPAESFRRKSVKEAAAKKVATGTQEAIVLCMPWRCIQRTEKENVTVEPGEEKERAKTETETET